MTVTCFLPCRKGSERVPRKNIRPFAGHESGLLAIKLDQLLDTRSIDRIILSTNDEEILDYARRLDDPRLELRLRDEHLSSSATSTDQLIEHVGSLIDQGDVLWTHVTSPFLTAGVYDQMIARYREARDSGYDSLMSVTELQGFLWDDRGPVNYDREIEKWPRTQTLPTLYEVNSGVFLAPAETYRIRGDRIGANPYRYVLDRIQGFDIDWEEDFLVAEALSASGIAKT